MLSDEAVQGLEQALTDKFSGIRFPSRFLTATGGIGVRFVTHCSLSTHSESYSIRYFLDLASVHNAILDIVPFYFGSGEGLCLDFY